MVEVRHRIWADDIATPASFAWSLDHSDPAERSRHWVATESGRVIGFAVGGRAVWTTGRVGYAYVGVLERYRRRGIGGTLFELVDGHLARLEVTGTRSGSERGDRASAGFLRARGFRHTRDDQAWSVDPRTVSFADLEARRSAAEARGLRLVPMSTLLERPEVIYRLNLALERDLPSDDPIASTYDAWRRHELEPPTFSPEASFCVLAGEEPVAMTWLQIDLEGGRARHGMTGVLPAFRHQGLARLVKLASLRWLAEHGVTRVFTDNDMANRDMLALNEHLGYQPLTVFAMWVRDAPPHRAPPARRLIRSAAGSTPCCLSRRSLGRPDTAR